MLKLGIILSFKIYLHVEISSCLLVYSNYFSLKSQTPKLLESNVVYIFSCLCDTNLTYIGKTKRYLVGRSLEHLKFEKAAPKSEIKEYLKKCLVSRKKV